MKERASVIARERASVVALKRASVVALMCFAGAASAQDGPPPERRGPPPEFLEACKGKADGTKVEAKNMRGDVVPGTCRMMMVPAKPAGKDGAKRERPPRQ